MPMTVEDAQKELAKVNKHLQRYQHLVARKKMLEQFLSLAEQLAGDTEEGSEKTVEILHRTQRGQTGDVAYSVLRTGTMHMADLLKKMRASGWPGTGDDKKDTKAIYVALRRQPDRFVNIGKNTWKVSEEKEQSRLYGT